ncbi:uncharacterized protein LOC110231554, partial [Exaiptasia diaphana]|uniref:Uncharacterized protein n=1 Tax=Exaiptasia diaphana TaxID=2652724 RepID=A0A913WPR9_EXADI
MAAKLLSSLVQTKSIELVMAPLAAQVSQLIILNEAGEKEGIPMPMLVSHAEKITSAIHDLVIAAQTLVNESNNEVFKSEMPEACALVTAAGNSLHDATNKLLQHPFSREVRYALVDSARNILETTMKVLLVYDKAEVQKIVCATCWVIDRLGLTEAVTSMDGFLVSFRGFSESLVLLVSLCNKRQRELSNSNQRSRLLSAMAILRQAVGVLSSTMQVYFSNPSLTSAKVNRDYVIGQIKFACKEIIKIVENRHDEDNSELPSLSSNMQKAYNQLDSKAALETSNQMDCYLDAIVRSSMAVADLSHDDSRDKIVEACQNVLETRNDLAALQNVMSQTSESGTSSQDYDETTEKLSKGLKELD